jgi:hypothetical protein
MSRQLPSPLLGQSRFSGRDLASIFALASIRGCFDDDVWTFSDHPQVASSTTRDRVHWSTVPTALREQLKELMVIAADPSRHLEITTALAGVRVRHLSTIHRWIPHLCVDLAWLSARAGSLAAVTQDDLDAWAVADDLDIDYRRIGAIQSFARYCAAMTPTLDVLSVTPWPGQSALSVAGGFKKKRANSTLPLDVEVIGPWLEGAMMLVRHADEILTRATRALCASSTAQEDSPSEDEEPAWLPTGMDETEAREWLRDLAAACLFVTAAFSGMRATELETIPRRSPLSAIEVAGVKRWLLVGHLVKGMPKPRREQWLVPPIVGQAIEATIRILQVLEIPSDRKYPPIRQAALFDHRISVTKPRNNARTRVFTLNLSRSIASLGARLGTLAAPAGMRAPSGQRPQGRQLRRTFAMIVAARPGGPQAAMDQFKWQHADTAAGYFRLAPDSVALSQRELYEDIRELQRDAVLNVAVREYDLWARAVEAGETPAFPAGPDGRRKRDLFASVQASLLREPRIVEDDRRLRSLLRPHLESIYLTEFGLCDYNEEFALCRGVGGPAAARCRPNECLNASTWVSTIAAHQVRHRRFVRLSKDRSMPMLARAKIKAEAQIMERDLGDLLEATQ